MPTQALRIQKNLAKLYSMIIQSEHPKMDNSHNLDTHEAKKLIMNCVFELGQPLTDKELLDLRQRKESADWCSKIMRDNNG